MKETIRLRLEADRLARWGAIVSVPVLWFAVALANLFLLVLAPLAVGLLALLFRYGPAERYPQPEGPLLAPPYSTVTVFARLRGWSTFRPRRRAMR